MYRHKIKKYKSKINKITKNMIGGGGTIPDGLVYPQEPTCDISSTSVKIIKAHGALTGHQFKIYEGVRIITVVRAGTACPFSEAVETNLTAYYRRGYTLFTNGDTTNTVSERGAGFISWLNEKTPFGKDYEMRNHVGTEDGLLVNDTILSFVGTGCSKEACSINCIIKKDDEVLSFIPNKIPMWYGYKNISGVSELTYYPIENILLSELVRKEGMGTYILFVCRSYDTLPEPAREMIRRTSRLIEGK